MTNKQIAGLFKELASLMEYHGENPFKIRSYSGAYMNFRRLDEPLIEMDDEALHQLPGVGKAILDKLRTIRDTGTFETLERFRAMTPVGIREMLGIRGIGPKKLKTLVDQLEIESPGELLYACQENRLVEIKGFGAKTQANILQSLEYFQQSRGKLLYRDADQLASDFRSWWMKHMGESELIEVGELALKSSVVSQIEFMTDYDISEIYGDDIEILSLDDDACMIRYKELCEITLLQSTTSNILLEAFELRGNSSLVEIVLDSADTDSAESEADLFEMANMPYVPTECREYETLEEYHQVEQVIESDEIQGIVHNHSTWSDGNASIEVMAERCIALGYKYFGIADHSRSAFYANGLSIVRVYDQWVEIDSLNEKLNPSGFQVLKGIESDILSDGRLDYPDEVLKGFDYVVASVHSQLRMDESKATTRIIKAVENPYTSILGHPTGRLLLARSAYPLDHMKVIDACAANGVHIELNANPLRLDMDWTWIPYAMEKGVMISINPDAHSPAGIEDVQYGVIAARKGLLTTDMCLNALSCAEFLEQCR